MKKTYKKIYKNGVYFVRSKDYSGHLIINRVRGKKSFEYSPVIGINQNGTVNDLNGNSNIQMVDVEEIVFVKFAIKQSDIKHDYTQGVIMTKNNGAIELKRGDKIDFQKADGCYVEGFEDIKNAEVEDVLEIEGYFNYVHDDGSFIYHCYGSKVLDITVREAV